MTHGPTNIRIPLVQDIDQWPAFVNTVMILGSLQEAAVSRGDDPQEGLSYTQIF